MKKKTLKALKSSIQKWHNNTYYGRRDFSSDDCPLCVLYHRESPLDSCGGCPVYEQTGEVYCRSTPFMNRRKNGGCLAELKYLVSLLPDGESAEMTDGWVWYNK